MNFHCFFFIALLTSGTFCAILREKLQSSRLRNDDESCRTANVCGDGNCCKFMSGCMCSAGVCVEVCLHGSADEGNQGGGTPQPGNTSGHGKTMNAFSQAAFIIENLPYLEKIGIARPGSSRMFPGMYTGESRNQPEENGYGDNFQNENDNRALQFSQLFSQHPITPITPHYAKPQPIAMISKPKPKWQQSKKEFLTQLYVPKGARDNYLSKHQVTKPKNLKKRRKMRKMTFKNN